VVGTRRRMAPRTGWVTVAAPLEQTPFFAREAASPL
jgi:hypothetical protein